MSCATACRFRLFRLVLAYAIALQTLLGAFAGAQAGTFDPLLSLCRSSADGETQPSEPGTIPAHCAVMCASGACSAGDSPATVSTITDYPPVRCARLATHLVSWPLFKAPWQGVNARGPPLPG